MKGSLFLIHWNPLEAQELAGPLRAEGWDVNVEAKDGARAGKMILTHKPDAVVIYLSRLPSHGCVTAQGVRSYKSGRNIPIIFVDGKKKAVQKTKMNVPDGMFIKNKELKKILDGISEVARRQK
jgi:DNA-binding NarL/FixJ family response regulator